MIHVDIRPPTDICCEALQLRSHSGAPVYTLTRPDGDAPDSEWAEFGRRVLAVVAVLSTFNPRRD